MHRVKKLLFLFVFFICNMIFFSFGWSIDAEIELLGLKVDVSHIVLDRVSQEEGKLYGHYPKIDNLSDKKKVDRIDFIWDGKKLVTLEPKSNFYKSYRTWQGHNKSYFWDEIEFFTQEGGIEESFYCPTCMSDIQSGFPLKENTEEFTWTLSNAKKDSELLKPKNFGKDDDPQSIYDPMKSLISDKTVTFFGIFNTLGGADIYQLRIGREAVDLEELKERGLHQ